MKNKDQLEYEERVKNRVILLKEIMEKEDLKFRVTPEISKSLQACKFDTNGKPDLKTVDGSVRSMALLAEQLYNRKQYKDAISLNEIQNRYFSIMEGYFGFFYDKMLELNNSPHELAHIIAYNNHKTSELQKRIEIFLPEIFEFWDIHSEPAYIHIEDLENSIKGVFGGDLFPSNTENIASKCGIYTDTIILPCPFVRSKKHFERWDNKQKIYYALKHALNVLKYKTLAIADTDLPIVAILPDKEMMMDDFYNHISKLGETDAIYHVGKIFNRKFESMDDLWDYSIKLDTIDKVINEVKDKKRILFDLDYKDSLYEQLKEQITGESAKLLGINNPGLIIAQLGMGRMSVANELLIKSSKLGGTPLIDAPTSWEYFKWKLEYDSERTHPNNTNADLHIVKGLNHLGNTHLQWLGKIPPEGLIEIRKSGAIDEIRAIISKGIDEITMADSLNFVSTSHKVFNNINKAFKQHQDNIKKLNNKKWKIAGKDIGTWLVAGSIEISAAATGSPIFGLPTVVLNQLFDMPKLKDLPKSYNKIKEVEKKKQELSRSPLGMIFKYK